ALNGEHNDAVVAAARIFKRGVATETTRPSTSSGTYDIVTTGDLATTLAEITGRWLVVDNKVATAWPKLPVNNESALIQTSELSKTLATIADILDIWRAAGKPKKW